MTFEKKYDAKEKEKQIRDFWEKENIYKFDENSKKVVFSIDTPPPTISGKMHIGHAFSFTQTDFMARFKRQKGFEVFYPFGTDDNGLATEKLVQKTQKVNLRKIPREEAIKICTDFLTKERPAFIQDFKQVGLSCDFNLAYSTIDEHSRTISQTTFLELAKKGLVTRKEGPVMWDRVFQTPIAQAELEDEEKKSLMNYVKAKIVGTNATYAIYATTRPELLFACAGMSVEDNGQYVKLKVQVDENTSEFWIISAKTYEENMKKFKFDEENFKVVEKLTGQNLIGEKAIIPIINKEIKITHDEAVLADFGTGIAYFCSYGGIEDIEYFARHKLDPIEVLAKDGRLNNKCGKYEGIIASEARPKIIKNLKESKDLIHSEKITHIVNVGERSGVEVEYIVTKQWYVNYLDKKEYFFEMAQKFNWHPEFMKHRLENWIKGLNWNWGFSRQRHYGIPIPVWHGKESGKSYFASMDSLPIDPNTTKPKLKKTIQFVRHAHYEKNDTNQINIDPKVNFVLSKKGIEQSKEAKENIDTHFDAIYTSEFTRTKQTAKLLIGENIDTKANQIENFNITKTLNEIVLGKDSDTIETYHKNVKKDITNKTGTIENKQKELIKFIEELKQSDDQNILVVTHKDNLKLIKSHFEKIDLDAKSFIEMKFENVQSYKKEFNFKPSEELIPETDIMDTWFTSASSPFLAIGLVKNEEMKKKLFPMDLRPQAHDIINFWLFYTMAKTNLLKGVNPFKNVAVSGWVLDPKGKKMSKSKGNTISPQEVTAKYSNDAIRFAASSTKLGNDIPYQEKEVQTGVKLVNKLYNANKFASMLLDDFKKEEILSNSKNLKNDLKELNSIDQWILARAQEVAKTANEAFENYDYQKAKQANYDFFMKDIADNYIEIVKTRLWKKKSNYKSAQKTLYSILLNVLKGLSPIVPYITEEIYQIFYKQFETNKIISIHLNSYPQFNKDLENDNLIGLGHDFISVVGAVRKFKSENSVSMKTELENLTIECSKKTKEFIENSIEDLKAVTGAKEIKFAKANMELNKNLKVSIEILK